MTIDELKQEVSDLEEQLLAVRAGMKTLYGKDYQEAEYKIIQIKKTINQTRVLVEALQYRSVANG